LFCPSCALSLKIILFLKHDTCCAGLCSRPVLRRQHRAPHVGRQGAACSLSSFPPPSPSPPSRFRVPQVDIGVLVSHISSQLKL
jgi:hypothetical protein